MPKALSVRSFFPFFVLSFPDFCLLVGEKAKEMDPETHFKDTFRVFSKDEEGD